MFVYGFSIYNGDFKKATIGQIKYTVKKCFVLQLSLL